MFAFAHTRARRKPALTPLIDVVFLLLVFFMLAAQFGRDGALDLAGGSGEASDYSGPPRLVSITPEQTLLNGVPMPLAELPQALSAMTGNGADAVVLRPQNGADVQRLSDVAQALSAAGFSHLVLVE